MRSVGLSAALLPAELQRSVTKDGCCSEGGAGTLVDSTYRTLSCVGPKSPRLSSRHSSKQFVVFLHSWPECGIVIFLVFFPGGHADRASDPNAQGLQAPGGQLHVGTTRQHHGRLLRVAPSQRALVHHAAETLPAARRDREHGAH